MDTELLLEYDRFICRDNPENNSVDKIIKYFTMWDTFHIKQGLIDANPRFLELIGMFDSKTKLEIHEIYGDELGRIMPASSLKNITEIRVWNSNINGFFKLGKYMTNLEYLSIDHHNTGYPEIDGDVPSQIIDDEFRFLSKLSNLSINSSKVVYFPEIMRYMTNLKHLNLDLEILIPKDIPDALQLEELGINIYNDNTDRDAVLEIISKVKCLKSFGYSDGLLKEIPKFKENLFGLERFTLNMLGLREIPIFVKNLTKLKFLNLRLRMDIIPEWIITLEKLKYIRLEALSSGILPLFLKKMPNLEMIELSGCTGIISHSERIAQIKEDFLDSNIKIRGVNSFGSYTLSE